MKDLLLVYKAQARMFKLMYNNIDEAVKACYESFTDTELVELIENLSREVKLNRYFLYEFFMDWDGRAYLKSFFDKFKELHHRNTNDRTNLQMR